MQNAATEYKIYNPEKYLNEGFNYPIGVIGEECSDIWNALINHIVNEDFDKYNKTIKKEHTDITCKKENLKAVCMFTKDNFHNFFGGQIKEWSDLIWTFEALLNAEYAYPPEKPLRLLMVEEECLLVTLKSIPRTYIRDHRS